MPIQFEKVQGLGNDFVLLDARAGGALVAADAAVRICDRHFGIGADGVLTLLPPRAAGAGARLHIYNADGSQPEMCGNGLRCAAKVLLQESGAEAVALETPAGVLRCESGEGGTIRAEIGRAEVGAPIELDVLGETVRGLAVSIGNPHLVIFADGMKSPVSEATARRLGPALEQHPRFAPGRTNVELCAVGPEGLTLFVWERGSGFTQACGTGACAAAAAAVHGGFSGGDGEIAVDLPGGRLHVRVAKGGAVSLRGPAERVFTGELRALPEGRT